MTRKEVTEIFSIMMLAWPNAEMFKGGLEKLTPTVILWAECLPDVDYEIGKRATIKLCKENTFPPSIAEFRNVVKEIEQEIDREADFWFSTLRTNSLRYDSLEQYYKNLSKNSLMKRIITEMGGPQALMKNEYLFDFHGFQMAYRRIQLRQSEQSLPFKTDNLISGG